MSDIMAQLVACLQATLHMDTATRQAAEQRLRELGALPGYCHCLVVLSLDEAVPVAIRQLAAVVLRQYVRIHWCEAADDFAPPCVPADERAAVRAALPAGLRASVPRVRTAVSMVIACIAQWDWPEEWPGLMAELLAPLHAVAGADGGAAAAALGALRCLEMCAGELAEEHMAPALQALA